MGEDERPAGNSQPGADTPSLSLSLLPPAGWEGRELGMVAACFLRNLYTRSLFIRIQPICVPFMWHKEMRQGSASAHTYFKSFILFFFIGLFSFFFKTVRVNLSALKQTLLLYSLLLLT